MRPIVIKLFEGAMDLGYISSSRPPAKSASTGQVLQ